MRVRLRDIIDSGAALAPGDICGWLATVAAALAYLHGQGRTHGDVSAQVIVLDRQWLRASLVPAPATHTLARESALPPTSPSSDLQALGVVLYEAACGITPTQAASQAASSVASSAASEGDGAGDGTGDCCGLQRPDGIPEPLWGLIERLLAEDPADRPECAAQVSRQLSILQQTLAEDPPAPRRRPRAAVQAAKAQLPIDPHGGARRSTSAVPCGGAAQSEPAERVLRISADLPEAPRVGARRAALCGCAIGLAVGAFAIAWGSGASARTGTDVAPANPPVAVGSLRPDRSVRPVIAPSRVDHGDAAAGVSGTPTTGYPR